MVVVDASVAVKWFAPEDQHADARALLRGGTPRLGPDLLLVEVVHVCCRKARDGEMTAHQVRAIARTLPKLLDDVVPSAPHIGRAAELALALNHSAYDCLYAAVAESRGIPLVTADQDLARRLRACGWGGTVKVLGA
jgi:predicted nucleic acid-binding protein